MSMASEPMGVPQSGPQREVVIKVLDGLGDSAIGAEVSFSTAAGPLGVVTIGDAGARIRLPDRLGTLTVVAEYGLRRKTARLTVRRNQYTFHFKNSLGYEISPSPVAQCPDGTTGQPCVECVIGSDVIRICA
jgi:hypothetical protein